MTELKKIFGTSFLSLLLVIWGLFMVCSGRIPSAQYADDITMSEDRSYAQSTGDTQLMSQLAKLDDESANLEDYQRREILEALGIEPTGTGMSSREEEFLTEELFLDLEVEIAELERISKNKETIADNLRMEISESNHQLAALDRVLGGTATASTSTSILSPSPSLTPIARTIPDFPTSNYSFSGYVSDFEDEYQDALNDVYSRDFGQAIAKFKSLLRENINHNLSDNCQYWIAESYYALGRYDMSIAEFEKVFAYDKNNKADDAQFMIGLAHIKLGDTGLAQLELNHLLSFYQNSEYVARAQREFSGLRI